MIKKGKQISSTSVKFAENVVFLPVKSLIIFLLLLIIRVSYIYTCTILPCYKVTNKAVIWTFALYRPDSSNGLDKYSRSHIKNIYNVILNFHSLSDILSMKIDWKTKQ